MRAFKTVLFSITVALLQQQSSGVIKATELQVVSMYLVLYPGMEKQGRTLAYSCSSFLNVKFKDL